MTADSLATLKGDFISTHILTRRMTYISNHCSVPGVISTHILTRRMTFSKSSLDWRALFQLTSSRGGWHNALSLSDVLYNISTHILTRRMTYLNACADSLALFQLTSSRGGWHNFFRYHIHQVVFQLTSSRGGWRNTPTSLVMDIIFQLTSSRGGWPAVHSSIPVPHHFNSHPHEEDDNAYVFYSTMFFISTHILTRRMTHILVLVVLIS